MTHYYSNDKVELRVRGAVGQMGANCQQWIVGRYDRTQDKWMSPVRFAPIGVHTSREKCQNALDEYAKAYKLEPVWNGGRE